MLMLRPSAVSDCEPKTVFPVGECVASSSALIVRACDHGRDGDSVYLRPQVTKNGWCLLLTKCVNKINLCCTELLRFGFFSVCLFVFLL